MDITNIKIKNIKGYGDPGLDWNLSQTPIKSNKINLVVASNGTGKSSLAVALQYVENVRIELKEKHRHNPYDENLHPLVSITIDGNTLICDDTVNNIKSVVTPYVINSPLIADTKSYYIPGGGLNAIGQMAIEKIEMQATTPNKNEIKVNTTDIKSSFGKNSKLITTINNNLGDSHFIECIGNMRDIFNNYSAQMRMNMVNAVIDNINSLDGTKEQLRRMIDNSYFSEIEEEPYYTQYVSLIGNVYPNLTKLDYFLFFFQLLHLYNHNRDAYNQAVKRAKFDNEWKQFNQELRYLDTTGRNIAAQETGNKVVVEYPLADSISNGQRDLLSFYCRLKKFYRSVNETKNYLLVIDEVFDYLDDANYIAAQYFLSKFMKESKANIFVVLFTHLDPAHFRSAVFSEKVLNVLYLSDISAKATPQMTSFLALRQKLDKNNAADTVLYNNISACFLHYNPSIMNIEADLLARHEQNLQTSWGKGMPFLQVLIEEVNKYVSGDKSYDPYAVATALRIRIEKTVYDSLSQNNQVEFLKGTKCKTTKQKLKFAEDNGVSVNEIFYMAIPITNDADHLTYIKGTNKLDEHPLVYKLNHPVLRHIVSEVFDYSGKAITINAIH